MLNHLKFRDCRCFVVLPCTYLYCGLIETQCKLIIDCALYCIVLNCVVLYCIYKFTKIAAVRETWRFIFSQYLQ